MLFYVEEKTKKPLKKISRQDKALMIHYHDAGLTSKEIKKVLGRKYTLGQIAAVKANTTMGRYN
jgi:hypothetical protein